MRKWIDAVLNEGANKKTTISEEPFGFLKSLGSAPAPKKAGLQPAKGAASFGKRTPATPVQTPMDRALADVAQAVAWAGDVQGAKQAIVQAARENGVSAEALAKAITPEMIRQWHRNV